MTTHEHHTEAGAHKSHDAGVHDQHESHAGATHSGAGMGSSPAHDRHEGHSVAMFRDKFWLSLVLSVPAIVWSDAVQHLLGYSARSSPARRISRRFSARSSSSMAAFLS